MARRASASTTTKLPDAFVGVFNTKNLYWLALGYVVVVFVVVRWAVDSSPGRVWQAIRENELRVEVLGLRPFAYKLMAFVLASFLATVGGVVYVLLIGGATPDVTTPNFTLALLRHGRDRRRRHALGRADRRRRSTRTSTTGSATSPARTRSQQLPSVLRTPLSEPLFILGVLFILVVYFAARRARAARPESGRAACARSRRPSRWMPA